MSATAAEETGSKIRPLEQGFGAWLDYEVTQPLSDVEIGEIADAFHQYRVLIFRNADLSLAQLAAFIAAFGAPDQGVGRLASDVNGYAGIRVVENLEKGAFGPRSNSELHWHSDRFFDPVVAGLLNSVVVPEVGGDTSFADMARALDTLPQDLRAAIEGRTIKQDCLFAQDGTPLIRPGGVVVDDVVNTPGIETAMIQTCRFTGRRYLYLGNRLNAYVPGLSLPDSEALLDRLYAHIDQAHLHYRHHWARHELILYDNRLCMHRRESFDIDADRKLYASVVTASDML